MRVQVGFALFVAYSGQPQLITGGEQLSNDKRGWDVTGFGTLIF
jgi:hypothetical protein